MNKDVQAALGCMTETQRRRYLFWLKGWSLTRIALKDGVSPEAVRQSINSGKMRASHRIGSLKTPCNRP
jgi:hypothetical protein